MKVRTKLPLPLIFGFAVGAVILYVQLRTTHGIVNDLDEVVQHSKRLQLARGITELDHRLNWCMLRVLLDADDREARTIYDAADAELRAQLDEAVGLATTTQELNDLREMIDINDHLVRMERDVLAGRVDRPGWEGQHQANYRAQRGRLINLYRDWTNELTKRVASAHSHGVRRARNGQRLGYVLFAVLLLGATAALVAVILQITRPLSRLALAADRLGEGDLDVDLPPYRPDEIGAVGHALAHMVASLKAREEQLSDSERRYRQLIESAQDMILLLNREGRILYANPSVVRLTGWTPEEALAGRLTSTNWLHPEDLPRLQERLRRAFSGQPQPVTEFRGRHKDGHYLWVAETLSPMRDQSDHVSAVQSIATDVTPRKELEAELAASARLASLGRLVGDLAHDFNNLITAIQGHAELALSSPGRPVERSLDAILRAARRAGTITANLGRLVRREEPKEQAVELAPLVDEALGVLAHEYDKRHIEVRCAYGPVPQIVGDRDQLCQVFLNLAENALDSMRTGGGRLEVVIRQIGDNTEVRFTDNGPPIEIPAPEETIMALLDELPGGGRESGDLTRYLGLAVTQRIVHWHHGTLEIESSADRGTSLVVVLPIGSPESVAAEDQEPPSGACRPARVLVVEDEREVRELLVDILESEGHTVESCGGGQAAVAKYRPGRFDIVFCDVVMPGESGLATLRRILEIDESASVVMLTGRIGDDITEEALYDGAVGAIQKPYNIDQISGVIARIQSQQDSE